jgi:transposase InsO family protein
LNDPREAVIAYLTEQLRFVQRHLAKRPKPTEGDKCALARAAKALDPLWLEKTFHFFRPSTLFRWYQELIARKWDYSYLRGKAGRPRVDRELEELVVQLALENPHDGYETLVGRLKILGIVTNAETVQNILERNGISPSRARRNGMTWDEFIHSHEELMFGMDFFTWEILTPFGLDTFYVLFLIHLKSRKVHVAGVTRYPGEEWMKQVARNLTQADVGLLENGDFTLHDRDGKFCSAFDQILKESGVRIVKLPAQSPDLNAFAERFVRTVKERCLSRLIVTSEDMLRRALREFVEHYHHERPHQGIGNVIPLPRPEDLIGNRDGEIVRKSRLGSLLNFYHRVVNADTPTTSPKENVA